MIFLKRITTKEHIKSKIKLVSTSNIDNPFEIPIVKYILCPNDKRITDSGVARGTRGATAPPPMMKVGVREALKFVIRSIYWKAALNWQVQLLFLYLEMAYIHIQNGISTIFNEVWSKSSSRRLYVLTPITLPLQIG